MVIIELLQSSPITLLIFTFLLGLMIGSFLNVVIHRLPLMMEVDWRSQCQELLGGNTTEPGKANTKPLNLISPRSRCPHCGHQITALENIPILSYLVLRGRCSACQEPISLRYPIIELVTALLSVTVVWKLGFTPAAGSALLLTWALVALTMIDFDHQLLPDSITLPFLWLGLILSLFEVFIDPQGSIIGAAAGYLSLWSVYHLFRLLTGKQGMGYGDFKLLALFGAWFGWKLLPVTILLSSLVGAIVGITLIVLRGHDRNIPIPFGPYLAAAGWIAMLWGEQITKGYLAWVAP